MNEVVRAERPDGTISSGTGRSEEVSTVAWSSLDLLGVRWTSSHVLEAPFLQCILERIFYIHMSLLRASLYVRLPLE